jgi:hypothetical protein
MPRAAALTTEPIAFTDRYEGIGYPDPATVCKGSCEGMGVYPLCNPERQTGEARLIAEPLQGARLELWMKTHAEAGDHDCDGWHFVTCPDCSGTGKRT